MTYANAVSRPFPGVGLYAAQKYQRARFLATAATLFARLLGSPTGLLSLDEAKGRGVFLAQATRRQDIPLRAVTGSVGRSRDYTRGFLPRLDADGGRWIRIHALMTDPEGGLGPIEVYKLGERYFVLDGHHRVSVARSLGNRSIEAFVTELKPVSDA